MKKYLLHLFFLTTALLLAAGYSPWAVLSRAQDPPPRRVNIPHFDGEVNWAQTAVFWFGKDEQGVPGKNYVDVRATYTNWSLQLQVTTIDYYLWYKPNASLSDDLTQYEAVAVYLDTANDGAQTPQADDYYFLVGARRGEGEENYERQARGNNGNWNTAWSPLPDWKGGGSGMSWASGGPGPNDNSGDLDYGWIAYLTIPWVSIGMSGPPPEGTVLGMGLQLYDRDAEDAFGLLAPEAWPENFAADTPASWGELHLGYADYQPSSVTPAGTTVIRAASPTDNTVEDAWLGGGTDGIGGVGSDPQNGSDLNHGDDERLFVGSETAPTHFPFFNKSFLRFSLDAIPPGKEIISATLTLQHWGNAGQRSSLAEASWVSLYTISDDWQEMSITWNNAPLAQENIAAAWIEPLASFPGWDNTPFYNWNATQAVSQAYAAGEAANLAIYSSDSARDTSKYLTSSETGDWNQAGRPTLTVVWGNAPDGFSLGVTPATQAINPGGVATYTIQVQASGNFSSPLTLTIQLPSALTYTVSPTTLTFPYGQAALVVTDLHTGTALLPGEWYTLAVTATSGSLTHTHRASANLLVGGARVYLPLVMK